MDTLPQSVIPQTYWDKGLEYFKNEDPSTTAIQQLYSDWRPPFNLNSLATIIGALYGDTYWASNAAEGQRMSVTSLANDISAAIGINIADATRAAQFAFSRWNGLFVRGNFGSSGEIPKTGALTASPDVLVNGLSPLSPPLIIGNWNQDTWGPKPGLKNYAYGRAQSLNIGVTISQPSVSMYYTDAGFLPPPSSWTQVFTFDGKNTDSPLVDINLKTDLAPGTRAASKEAFGVNFPGDGHYCMITAAASEFFSKGPDAGLGNWNSATWLQFNGAAGWHNVDVSRTGQAMLKFYNQDGTAERFVFEAHCHHLDEGATVCMAVPGIAGKVEGRITRKHQVFRIAVEVPGNHVGALEVDFGKLPPNASITFLKYWVVSRGHDYHREAAIIRGDLRAAINGEPVLMPMGDYTFVGKLD